MKITLEIPDGKKELCGANGWQNLIAQSAIYWQIHATPEQRRSALADQKIIDDLMENTIYEN